MIKNKIKEVLYFVLLMYPLTFFSGLNCILLSDMKITDITFQVIKIRKKTKKEIDKEKFAKMMRRLTK